MRYPKFGRVMAVAALSGALTLFAACGGEEESATEPLDGGETIEFDADAAREGFEKKAEETIDADNVEEAAEALQRELDADK